MKYEKRNILVTTILILSLCMFSNNAIADPVVQDVTISPQNPESSDTVTITATITGDDISEVTLKLKECTNDPPMCWTPVTYPMTLSNGEYTATHDLEHPTADYFGYLFMITDNGTATETEYVNVTITKKASNGGTNGNGGNGDGNGGLPGFELVPLLVAIAIGVLLLRRKRSG
jgi:hypothetical protein